MHCIVSFSHPSKAVSSISETFSGITIFSKAVHPPNALSSMLFTPFGTFIVLSDIQSAKEQKIIEYKKLADVKNISELDLITLEWKDRFSKLPKEVENLIKLVRLRLSATEAGIKLVRQASDVTRIYMSYTKPEWNMIYQKIPRNITKYLTYTMAPKSCKDGNSILLLKSGLMDFEELFNILEDLFYHINITIKSLTEN